MARSRVISIDAERDPSYSVRCWSLVGEMASNYATVAAVAWALVSCGPSAAPRASSAASSPPGSASATRPKPSLTASAPSPEAGEPCHVAEPGPTERAVVDWEIQLVHGSFGRITALAANAGGVLAAGADSHERVQSEAIVASFTVTQGPNRELRCSTRG